MNNNQPSPTRSELAPSNDGARNDTNQTLSMPEMFTETREWPQEIIVEPSRLVMGIWGDKEGDISAAYCGDTFPKVKTFLHEGQLYISSGGSDNSVTCYPLIPTEQYSGRAKQPYSREGETVNYRSQSFTLGAKMKFTARPLTLAEEISLLRRQYAYGGYFAAGKTYRELLTEYLDSDEIKQGLKTALEAELASDDLPNTQTEMLARLGGQPRKSEDDEGEQENMQPMLPGL